MCVFNMRVVSIVSSKGFCSAKRAKNCTSCTKGTTKNSHR